MRNFVLLISFLLFGGLAYSNSNYLENSERNSIEKSFLVINDSFDMSAPQCYYANTTNYYSCGDLVRTETNYYWAHVQKVRMEEQL